MPSQELNTLAVGDKNIFFTSFSKNHRHGCKMLVLGHGCLSQHILESS